jgi:hypothetical protein
MGVDEVVTVELPEAVGEDLAMVVEVERETATEDAVVEEAETTTAALEAVVLDDTGAAEVVAREDVSFSCVCLGRRREGRYGRKAYREHLLQRRQRWSWSQQRRWWG